MICERLVQLSAAAELREAARVPASINNSFSGVQGGRENEKTGKRGYTFVPQGQT